MFRGDRHRRKGPANPPAVPSTILQSSSLSPSASPLPHPAAPPSNLSQSDIVNSDHSVASPLPTPTKKQRPAAVSPAPRSSSLGAMGQTHSQSQLPVPPSPIASAFSNPASTSKGFKLKRAFGVGRKQTDDSNPISLALHKTRSRGKDNASLTSSTQASAPARRPLGAKQLSLQLASAFSPKQNPPAMISPTFGQPSPPPPPPPPKNLTLQATKINVTSSEPAVDNRGSIMTSSPSIAAAVQHLQHGEQIPGKESIHSRWTEPEKKDQEKAETKEAWRKSDSNMSFNTIRPGATAVGNRTSRPVSMAESLQSTHTIVPVNKRLSALVTDAEFVMAEEDDGERGEDTVPTPLSTSGKTSPSGSIRSRNRRSASLNLPIPFAKMKGSSPPSASVDERLVRSSADNPRLTPSSSATEASPFSQAAVSGYITSTGSCTSLQSTSSNAKDHLTAWSASSSPTQQERKLPDVPPQYPYQPHISPDGKAPPTLRQTAVSITSGFAPAAGLAKRAVEKMGRAWGGMHSTSSSGCSSSSSTGTAPSTYSGNSVEDLRPTPGLLGTSSKGKRRTPNAPSGSWSLASSTTSSSISDSDAYSVPAGPFLGHCIRGPTRLPSESGGVAKGAVFGRDLKSCVAETALQAAGSADMDDGRPMHSITASDPMVQKDTDNKELEARRIPALVARCAQHILVWGVQEEGLFRVTGRPTHVGKIRAEFDTGADYDLSECNVGDLDPHAVSSVFKAYLRELPEPILTHALMPYFDAALSTEHHNRASQEAPQVARGMRGPNVTGGIPAMRKPPSLSTLAMPNFSAMRPPSEPFVNALTSLIAALPQENRDLLRTVTDLIKATAKRSKETKMPLSNLLLVFCPSLNMNPPLLRALCEADGIWDASRSSSEDAGIMDTPITASPLNISNGNDRASITTREQIVVGKGQPVSEGGHESRPLDRHTNSSEVEAISTIDLEATYGSRPLPRAPLGARRAPVATLYVDSEYDDDASRQSFQTCASTFFPASPSDAPSWPDRSCSVSPALPNPHSPPSLSSSTDSLATPSTISSGAPSASHLPLPDDKYNKSQISSHPESPVIVESTDLPLPSTPQRHNISHPILGEIQFPIVSIPSTPVTRRAPPPPLSLTESSSHLNGPASSPSSLRARRIKKPSLHALFTRRSSASLHAATLSTASISAPFQIPPSPMSSVSTPLSMFTAKSSTSSLPPMLDTAIETLPLGLGVGLDDSKRNTYSAKPGSSHSTQTVTKSPGVNYDRLTPHSASTGTPGPHETPIANLYSTPSSSVLSFDASEYVQAARPRPQVKQRPSQLSVASTASYDHLSIVLPDEDPAADDWAESVLAAADVNGTWSVKNAIKFFGGGS